MEDSRLDDLARAVGNPGGRRRVLRALAGAALGGLIGARGLPERAAAARRHCPRGTEECRVGRFGWYCADVGTDEANCGRCGHACPEGSTCAEGVCCPRGTTNCRGICVDLKTDERHCGRCG